jgi:hypothetical protein
MTPHINVEVHGIFNHRMIRETLTISISETTYVETLLQIIGGKIGLSDGLAERNPIILLNSKRLSAAEPVRLTEDDTLSILSPLAGG